MHDPIFKTVLGNEWSKLGNIVRKHYSLKPFSKDFVRVDGVMDEIYHSTMAKLLIPFGLFFGANKCSLHISRERCQFVLGSCVST